MNRDRQPHDAARLSVDVVTSADAKQLPAVSLDQSGELPGRRLISYGDFNDPVAAAFLRLRDIDRKAALDGLLNVGQKLIHRLALAGAAGNGRDFRPEAALFRLVHNHLDLHAPSF